MKAIYRGPDGRHWVHDFVHDHFDEGDRVWVFQLSPAVQDAATGRWELADHADPIEVVDHLHASGYTEVSANPLGEPRVALLHTLLTQLLADYEQHTGHAHPRAADLHTAFEDVAALPEQQRRHGRRAGAQAARAAAPRYRR
ncbi:MULTISPECIES: hypothetical protein [Streptomyces]|uniref:hypothetical protein n=1 Tax=Streptomyces TaxID=1883 RepID=UPI0035DC561B